MTEQNAETLPFKQLSPAYATLLRVVEQSQADAMDVSRGIKIARTRLRVKLAQIAKLCKEARKDIKPAGAE